LKKKTGTYQTEWGHQGNHEGEFQYPRSIYFNENILYIGDKQSIQLFDNKGLCLQRIEKFENKRISNVTGICLLQGCLCVRDCESKRISVFREQIPVWNCPKCRYENPLSKKLCGMCLNPGPTKRHAVCVASGCLMPSIGDTSYCQVHLL